VKDLDRHGERGISKVKLLFWLVLIGVGTIAGYDIIPVYNANWKVQDTFDGVVRNMSDDSETEIRKRLPELFKIKYLSHGDVPEEFYTNLKIKADGNRVEISSAYHVTVWLLFGPVQGVDPDSDYDESDLKGMDMIRQKLRFDFDFEPHAETP